MSTASELLQQLEGFTELIAAAIDSNDWDDLNEMLANRQHALNQLAALSLSDQEYKLAVEIMISMQNADSQFLASVQNQKEALQKQAASLAHDRKAVQAYQSE
jgi:hypothetical protein